MLVRLIFFVHTLHICFIVLCTWISHASANDCCSTAAPRLLEVFQENVLKRRTRSVIFPKKAQVLITPSFAKGVLGGIPRGLSYTIEFDMYHMLPDTVEGWKPTILINKIEKEKQREQAQQVIAVTKTPSSFNYTEGNTAQNGYYYDPFYVEDYEPHQSAFGDYKVGRNSWDFGLSEIDNGQTYFTR